MDQKTPAKAAETPPLTLPRWEFIALAAALMALNALAIDIMLPGLQEIGASLGVEDENHRQYVISAYLLRIRACPTCLWTGFRSFRPPPASSVWPRCLCRCGAGRGVCAELCHSPRAPFRARRRCCRDAGHCRVCHTRYLRRPRDGGDHVAGLHGFHDRPRHRAQPWTAGDAVFRMAHGVRVDGWNRAGRYHLDRRAAARDTPPGLSSAIYHPFDCERFGHRTLQPDVALLHAGHHNRIRGAVRIHQLGATGLCRNLWAWGLVSRHLRGRGRHDGGVIVRQRAIGRPVRHAASLPRCSRSDFSS